MIIRLADDRDTQEYDFQQLTYANQRSTTTQDFVGGMSVCVVYVCVFDITTLLCIKEFQSCLPSGNPPAL